MRAFNELTRYGIAWASVFTLVMSVVGLTGCERKGSVSEHPGQTLVNDLPPTPGPEDPWTADRLVEAEHLAKGASDPNSQNPLVLYVGPAVLYKRAHIPGAKSIGPTSEPDGLKSLQREAQTLGRDREVVLYCGCCPWKVCPNVRPAFRTLQGMGFKRVKVLYLPHNLTQDWIKKGFPVEKGAIR
ncbi:MAG: rhodanese-like domain-containing protein [Acidobacteria bacterium]|nr:rhodanese-like domain-containing protein [Acidobacteriota bacterium]